MVDDLADLGMDGMSPYNPYEDKLQNVETFLSSDKESGVTLEWRDQYFNAEILLPRGDKMARCQVVYQKHDANGNPVGRSNESPIMDTCLHEVKHPGGETEELVANIITELIYAQCDVDGNNYLLLEMFINHKKNESALSVDDQNILVKRRETLGKSTGG